MVRNKANILARIVRIWNSGYYRGYRRGEKVWKNFAMAERARIQDEFESKMRVMAQNHAIERKALLEQANAAKDKLRGYRENIDFVEYVSNSTMALITELKLNIAGAFKRAAANQEKIESAIRQDKRLIKRMGEIE
jgi:hypothetical protein